MKTKLITAIMIIMFLTILSTLLIAVPVSANSGIPYANYKFHDLMGGYFDYGSQNDLSVDGWSFINMANRAWLSTNPGGSVKDGPKIPLPGAFDTTWAYAINNAKQVVGYAQDWHISPSAFRPFLWDPPTVPWQPNVEQGTTGILAGVEEYEALFPEIAGTKSRHFYPQDISNDGSLIVGYGKHAIGFPGDWTAWVWDETNHFLTLPVDEGFTRPCAYLIVETEDEGFGPAIYGLAIDSGGNWHKVKWTPLPTYDITITSSPAGSDFVKVGGLTITTPETFTWIVGSTHTLEALSPVAGPTDTQYVWTSWSDGGAQTHIYTVPDTPETVTATYKTQYLLTISVSPLGAGVTNPATGPQWFDYSSLASVTATPATGYFFDYWFLDGTTNLGSSNPITMTINSPHTIEARFITAQDLKQQVLTELQALRATVTDKGDGKKLDDAIDHLGKSLAPDTWVDGITLNPKHGERVFNEEKDAVVKLAELVKDKKSAIPDATLQGFINRLLSADRALASVAIKDAIGMGGDAKKIDKANEELGKGDAKAADNKFADAFEHYRNAWKHAQEALPH